jgi:hypothetical protein
MLMPCTTRLSMIEVDARKIRSASTRAVKISKLALFIISLKGLLKQSQSTPYIPQAWGTFKSGGHPQTPGRKYPAPLFLRPQIRESRMEGFVY